MKKVLVIGAGISGLTVAQRLQSAGMDVEVIEASNRAGGLIRTWKRDGYLMETGAEALSLLPPAVPRLIEDVHLEDRVISAKPAAAKRYVLQGGKFLPLPSSPISALTSPILSTTAKARCLMEPFVGKLSEEESLAHWVRRRFGSALMPLADAVATGVCAGNPQTLSVDSAFPQLKSLETKYGSAIIGALRTMRKAGSGPLGNLASFKGGMEELIMALSSKLDISLREGARRASFVSTGFEVATSERTIEADDLVIAAGPRSAFELFDGEAGDKTRLPREAPVALVVLGIPVSSIHFDIDAYGYLVPEEEVRFCLGVLFSSSIFEGRAPEGRVLLRCFVGGMRHPERASLPDDRLVEGVKTDIREPLGIVSEPEFVEVIRPQRGIAQMEMGHSQFRQELKLLQSRYAGLFFTGMGIATVSVSGLIAEAEAVAKEIVRHAAS